MVSNKYALLSILSLYCASWLSSPIAGLDTCNRNSNCSECIQSFGCRWCKADDMNESRCSNISSNSCPENMIEDPPSSVEIPLRNASVASSMSPSAYIISLRVGETKTLTVTYTDEENRPLDLYILMDLSCTMKKEKEKVVSLTRDLVASLRTLTKDLKLGFGSFVDKPIGPFDRLKVSDKPLQCEGANISIAESHAFKNHLSLTANETLFINSVMRSEISSNVDIPEGGLDALMQAISCTTSTNGTRGIGWRSVENKTRKLIVISTDGPFHIAGDGRLGGIVLPNDGKCHLDKDGMYTKAKDQDYPSISQIRDKIRENSVFVVFAVTPWQFGTYKNLVNAIGMEFASVQEIDDKNSTVDIIHSEYKKVLKQVSFLPVVNDYVDVVYYVKCPKSNEFVEGNDCSDLSPKAKVEIKVKVTLKKCPTTKLRSTMIQVSPSDSKGEHNALRIDLQMLCDCGCEMEGNGANKNSSESFAAERCSNKGFLQCGICKCNANFGGPTCNCPLEEGELAVNQSSCMDPSGRICSARGKCKCGECKCDEGHGGKLCQCNTNECHVPRQEDSGMCNSGLGQGNCGIDVCKQCKCNKGFHGERCQCPDHKSGCKAPEDMKGTICMGKGKCDCNKCDCEQGHHGQFCELRHSKSTTTGECNESLINDIKRCVECRQVDNAGVVDKASACSLPCDKADIEMVESIIGDANKEMDGWCVGVVQTKDKCDIVFQVGSWKIMSGKVKVQVEKTHREATCVADVALLPIILSLVGIILLIGTVLLVVWKIFTHIHDKNEFRKFQNETKGAMWTVNQNPLYKGTVSEFQNPAYTSEIEDDKNK